MATRAAADQATRAVTDTAAQASRNVRVTLAKDPKLGPLLTIVAATVGAALSVSATNFRHADTRHRDMRKDIISDETMAAMPERAKEAGEGFLRSILYIPGYGDNFEQTDFV
ncbi:uncharacterized protein MONBRDRAFT_25244 [Monosiga brevicollis MX1]|uniref:Uncharacterized protein n=1 Tax=Monosiga brevicollis TaxID=81824 RepID=A9UYU4_MONBE|nr:uncharacterized protein MONBRDRAFT_25244 [Monosiga brevicollis MX1]EDQ89522.1 predicted protein [Monosiga brevicollis MX1]|eukprot:XP_001745551.1 hypothetical protein [Monosiga brevicollis MX1]